MGDVIVWLLIIPVVLLWARVATLRDMVEHLKGKVQTLSEELKLLKGRESGPAPSPSRESAQKATAPPWERERARDSSRVATPTPTPIPTPPIPTPTHQALDIHAARHREIDEIINFSNLDLLNLELGGDEAKPVKPAPAPAATPTPVTKSPETPPAVTKPSEPVAAKPTPVSATPPTPAVRPTPASATPPAPAVKPTPASATTPTPAARPTPASATPPAPAVKPTPVSATPPTPAVRPTPASATTPTPAARPTPAPVYRPAPPPPLEPLEPTGFERFLTTSFAAAKAWLLGGNTVLRVGALLLFLGFAFLLRYASERVTVPIEVRYIAVAAAAFVLLALGWRLRLKNAAYGLMLQGTGIGVLYLTCFAAVHLHPLLPSVMAFGLMVLLTVAAVALAVMQDSRTLACAAALGGFAAPILTSSGGGEYVLLFSYFVLLDAGIALVAWFKAWRVLNLIGFISTFSVGIAWGIRDYTPVHFASVEPFLVIFFLMFVCIGLLFARRKLMARKDAEKGGDKDRFVVSPRSQTHADYLDGTLVLGPPLIGFGLQCAVIAHIEFGMAFSALVLGLFYMGLAFCMRGRRSIALMMEVCLALGVVFGTLAVPLAFQSDWHWTSAVWAVEGAGIYWIGHRQQRQLARAFSLLLVAAASLAWVSDLSLGALHLLDGASPFGGALLGVACLFCHFTLRRVPREAVPLWERPFQSPLAMAGLVFLYLIPPLCFWREGAAIAWALMGMATVFAGARLGGSRTFTGCALAVQSLGAILFLRGLLDTVSLGSGDALNAALIGTESPVISSIVAAVSGLAWLFSHVILRRGRDGTALASGPFRLPVLAIIGLAFLYLIPPLYYEREGAVIAWALMGMATVFVGTRLGSRVYLACAFFIQSLGALLFLVGLDFTTVMRATAPMIEAVSPGISPFLAGLLGLAWLFGYFLLRREKGELAQGVGPFRLPVLAIIGLVSLYLIPPLYFGQEVTIIAWALMGMATVFVGVRLGSRAFLGCAFIIQSLAGLFFLSRLDFTRGNRSFGIPMLKADSLDAALFVAGLLSLTWLFGYFLLRREKSELAQGVGPFRLPALAVIGLAFLYLTTPLYFGQEGTATVWALAGMATVFAAVWFGSRAFLGCAFTIQFLSGLLVLLELHISWGLAFPEIHVGNLLNMSPFMAGLFGVAWLFGYFLLRREKSELAKGIGPFRLPVLAIIGLAYLYLIAPLCLDHEWTVVAWALAGMATIFAGLRLGSRVFLGCAFAVQCVGGWLFLSGLKFGQFGTENAFILASGSSLMGTFCAVLAGFSLIASAIAVQSEAAKHQKQIGPLNIALLAGLIFINLALLFLLDWKWIGGAWAASGLLILWLGLWQRQSVMFYFGMALEAVAGVAFVFDHAARLSVLGSEASVSNGWVSAALALAAMGGAWRMHHIAAHQEHDENRPAAWSPSQLARFSSLLLVWSVGWWTWSAIDHMMTLVGPSPRADYLALLVLALSGGLWTIIARFARWRALALACLFPFVAAAWVLATQHAPLDWVVAATWVVFFAIYLSSLRWLPEQLPGVVLRSAHVAGVWLFVLVGMLMANGVANSMERAFAIAQYPTAWHWLGWALAPSLYLWMAGSERGRFWPFGAFEREYRRYAALPIMGAMLVWFWMANLVSNGDSSPLFYIPLFNPFELGLLLVLSACWRWSLVRLPTFGLPSRGVKQGVAIVGGASLFAFVTLAVCRGVVSVWKEIVFHIDALYASMAVQAGWSLVWALYALTLMIGGSLRKSRGAWLTGIVLIAIVVLKLLIVDLGDSLARIISFIGVGLLLLVVGYFAPLPPKLAEREERGEQA